MAVCGGCGRFGPDDARFCSSCGSPLAAAPLFDRSARKTVTVVFADIAGSTELGDRRRVHPASCGETLLSLGTP